MRIGFVGIGDQGGAIAEMIIKGGHSLHLWARRPEALKPFLAMGASSAESIAALASSIEVLCLCVVSDADVNEVLFEKGAMEALPPGAIVIIHSTIDPRTMERIASVAESYGVSVLDAPVSGGRSGALARRLLIMLGGDAQTIARAKPVLECYGSPIHVMGSVGTGQRAKILNNFLFAAQSELARAILSLGEKLGMTRQSLQCCLADGSANSVALTFIDKLFDPAKASHYSSLLNKDVNLAIEMARSSSADAGLIAPCARALLTALAGTQR